MAESIENKKQLSVINEKLYVDTYFHLLKSNEENDIHFNRTFYMRDMIRQINFHSETLNINKSGRDKFISDLYNNYFDAIDNIPSPDLLPVVTQSESSTKDDKLQGKLLSDSLKEIDKYFESINLYMGSEAKSSKTLNLSDANRERNIQAMSANIKYNSSIQQKRPADDSVHIRIPLKKSNFISKNTKTNSPVCQPTTSAKNGFQSASSMYRNPLKIAQNHDKISKTENADSDLKNHESLKHIDKKIVSIIMNEIMDFSPNIKWSDIAGLEFVKTTVQEIVIWPLLRPDIFTGLRAPPRGILLFGPPGTGKTLIGKCIATESNSTFFCISASSLASKWVGESEQLVRALFAIARLHQPAVIFVDEIDSLLSQRSDKDQDFTRKLKTEFLIQFDGAKTSSEERVLVVGATNRPHELDEAARRRFVKRLYVPLPEDSARQQIVEKLLSVNKHDLSESDFKEICSKTEGYSGSDVAHLCKEAAMGPIRSIGPECIKTVTLAQVRAINLQDFSDALRQVRASVAEDDLNYYLEWNKKFGSFGI